MIRHIVMWRLRGESAEDQRAARARLKTSFERLRGKVLGMRSVEVGFDVNPRPLQNDAIRALLQDAFDGVGRSWHSSAVKVDFPNASCRGEA